MQIFVHEPKAKHTWAPTLTAKPNQSWLRYVATCMWHYQLFKEMMYFLRYRYSHTHIPRDVCFLTHISLGMFPISDMCFLLESGMNAIIYVDSYV